MVDTVISQNDGFISITAVGGETELDGDFPIYSKSHVTIKRERSGTTTTLVLNTDYTIADDQLEVTAGFTAVLTGSATPAVAGDIYTLLLDVPESRTTDFTQAGDLFAATLNRELDLQTQISQQLRRDVDKSAHLPDTSTISTVILPEPEDGAVIGWDGTDGTMQNFAAFDENLVTPFIATLLDDASASAARTTLGLGTMATQNVAAMTIAPLSSGDNSLDLGSASKRWKDIYLSGGMYVGGSGSANYMTDYEEGTWTPSFASSSATFTYASQVGEYIKVGKFVHVEWRLDLTGAPSGTTSNALFLAGLPFTMKTISNMFFGGGNAHYANFNQTANYTDTKFQGGSGATQLTIVETGDNQAEKQATAAQLSSGAIVRGSFQYISA